MNSAMEIRDLIDGLGGGAQLAKRMGVLPSAISNWIAAGEIPAARHLQMWRLAVEAGIEWTPPGAEGLRLIAQPDEAA